MMRITVAFRAFFASLFSTAVAQRLRHALADVSEIDSDVETTPLLEKPDEEKKAEKKQEKLKSFSQKTAPRQNEAITLLAALQREARFVDFIQEPISGYTDAQIGAAARTVHDDCAKVLKRFFALEPVVDEPEESQITIAPENLFRFQFVGDVGKIQGQTEPITGTLAHPGWKATQTEIPQWTGEPDAAMIVAPAEVVV